MENFEREFPLDAAITYLNHAAVSPWPARTARAACAFAEENLTFGSLRYPRWLQTETLLRERLARMINAPSANDIALLKNTSEGLSVLAYGLSWQHGDNVVISNQEFPSNRIVWESLQALGVEVRQVDLTKDASPEAALLAACDSRTRLLSISSVQYATGLRIDLLPLGNFCRKQGIWFCVDAIQSLGALPLDVQAANIDVVAADGHKWLLGPEGVALFYVRPELREQLTLHQYGWHMVEHPHDFERKEWEVARSGRRFECGSPNMIGIHALNASVDLLLEVGLEQVEKLVLEKAAYLIERCRLNPQLDLITPSGRYGGIVTFHHRHIASERLHTLLLQQGVQCAQRGGGIRFSPHFYTPDSRLTRVMDWLERLEK